MKLIERAYSRGREIGAAADDVAEINALVAAFVRTHPEAANDSDLLGRLWSGIADTSRRLPKSA
jgi:hypothetical protein